jgi:pseudouridine kinase
LTEKEKSDFVLGTFRENQKMPIPSSKPPKAENRLPSGPEILIIGGCHMDVLGRSSGRFEVGTSCPGVVHRKPGGVARNVATLLARAGAVVRFSTIVGDDDTGRHLVEGLVQSGIETSVISTKPDSRTGSYLAIHDERGELVAAVSDLTIYDDYALPVDLANSSPRLVFADANIPARCLEALADRFGKRLCVDAISRAKAPKLRGLIGREALIVTNLPSAGSFLEAAFSSAADAGLALAAAGVRRAVISAGSQPLALLEDGVVTAHQPTPVDVVDVTGTGDAQIAGLLLARLAGRPLSASVSAGMQAARAALGCAGALERLPDQVLAAAGWPATS